MSYNVARRTNEIGMRMALGAQRQDVLRLVLQESMIAGRDRRRRRAGVRRWPRAGFVKTLLFGLPPTDALSIGAAVVIMVAVSALAGYLPARRASRVDPMVALRYE